MSDLTDRLREQLERWHLQDTAEAAVAMDIVARLAEQDIRPSGAAMLHAQLRALLVDLRALAPEDEVADGVAELQGAYEGLRAVE